MARSSASFRRCARRKNQQGFALLLVFLMAAVVAITLYMELPRVAMQSQRDKEEMLIDRGEQYKRAIQLFVAKAKRYPGDIKELENFQNQRFLRHRYIDPMTGKDEWRLVHIQNGMLTDSKVTKPNGPGGKEEQKTPNGFVGELAGLGSLQNGPQTGGGNQRDRRRGSDGANGTMPGPATGTGAGSGDLAGQNPGVSQVPGQPGDNGQTMPQGAIAPALINPATGQSVYPPGMTNPGQIGQPGMPGIPGIPSVPGTTSGAAGTSGGFVGGGSSFVGGSTSFVGGSSSTTQPSYPGLPGQPGAPVTSQGGGVSPYPTTPGANGLPPGFPQPGTSTGQGNAAADMIRNILTTPRPGGMPQSNPGGQVIGGGIAGVASTAEGEGVKVYNDRTLYQEWEFIFDPSKQKQIPNPNATGAGGTPADRMNGTGSTPNPNPNTNTITPGTVR